MRILVVALTLGFLAPAASGILGVEVGSVARSRPAIWDNPCKLASSNELCASAPVGGSGCTALAIGVRGLTEFFVSKVGLVTPVGGGASAQRATALAVEEPVYGAVRADVAEAACDVRSDAATSEACGNATATEFSIDLTPLGHDVRLAGDILTEAGCAVRGAGGSNAGRVANLTGVVGGVPIVAMSSPRANTVLSLGERGFVALNEQFEQTGPRCQRNNGAAVRVVLGSPHVEVLLSWVSLAFCKPLLSLETFSSPTGVVPVGTPAHDTLYFAGTSGPEPTGTVRFFLCGPSEVEANGGDCSAGGAPVGGPVPVVAGQAISATTSATWQEGKHCWRAEYSGDANWSPASHTDSNAECFRTVKLVPTLMILSCPEGEIPTGWDEVAGHARVTGPPNVAAQPTGAVQFYLCGPSESTAQGCVSGGSLVGGLVALDGDKAESAEIPVPSTPGKYCWRAVYGGDALYVAASHTDAARACFTVR